MTTTEQELVRLMLVIAKRLHDNIYGPGSANARQELEKVIRDLEGMLSGENGQ